MKKVLRITLIVAAFCLLSLLCCVIFGMNSKRLSQLTCAGLNVEFTDGLEFMTEDDVEGYLNKEYGAYIGQRLDSVDLMKVEKIICGKGVVLKAEAYTTPDGVLNIRITQRMPVLRLHKNGLDFYADKDGYIFPLKKGNAPEVMDVEGALPLEISAGYKGNPKTEKESEWLEGVIGLLDYMDRTGIWKRNIGRITVKQDGDIVLHPVEGKESFIFGKPDGYESKFDKIERYYTTILPAKGAGYYSTVNVKYDGQIVCRK